MSMLVSVIVPAYNHEAYIEAALRSVLDQSYTDIELIVIDDGSTDNTGTIIQGIDDPRVSYFYQENQGAHISINRGIEQSRGDYVSILNSDDIYACNRIALCVDYMQQHPQCGALVSRLRGIGADGKKVSKRDSIHIRAWLDWYKDSLPMFKHDQFNPNAFCRNIMITTSNLFVRREVFERVGLFAPLRYAHDWEMLLRLVVSTRMHLLDEDLLEYRIHPQNTVHENNSEALVRFEVNWLIARHISNMFQQSDDISTIFDMLRGNHYISMDALLAILAWSRANDMDLLLCKNHPLRSRIIRHCLS